MKKVSFSNAAKIAGISVSALLLMGATGCNKQEAATPATDTNTAPETSQTTTTPTPIPPNDTQVLVTDKGFEPKSVTIKEGETVTWTNNTSKAVRVASEPHPLHTGLPGLDDVSGMAPGDTYTFLFTIKGTWGYHDHNKSSVKGTVVVTE